jgi:hypothetical protein
VNHQDAGSVAAKRSQALADPERALWARRLALQDSLAAADLAGRHIDSKRFEAALQEVNDTLFRRWRNHSATPHSPRERFSYAIAVIDPESKRLLGHLVADETGVHTPRELVRPLPTNQGGRAWLKVVDPTKDARERALRSWHAAGHRGRPVCPGCRSRIDLVYLEFRNADPGDRFRTHPILAVCDGTAAELIHRARREVFGPTSLVRRIPWPCRLAEPALVLVPPESPTKSGPGRGGWRGDAGSLRALARARAARSIAGAHSLSAKPALAPLISSHASGDNPNNVPARERAQNAQNVFPPALSQLE